MSLPYEVLIFGLILSVDSFSAAMALGSRPFTRSDALKFAISSGGAEALVALIGFFTGSHFISNFGKIQNWIAFSILILIAIHMAYEGSSDLINKKSSEEKLEFHSFFKVLIVSFATSLDAFGVGISLGITHKPILPFIISIGVWAFVATLLGLNLARKLSKKFGPIMNFVGAIFLILIAFGMLKI